MTPFRQVILPGQAGKDVLAVKRALREMGVHGAGALIVAGEAGKIAGSTFVSCLERVQRGHAIKADGVYGPATHKVVAPHFDAYGRMLYRTSRIRVVTPPANDMSAAEAAQALIRYAAQGKYHADNYGDWTQIQATAKGEAVWSQMGRYVHIDPRTLGVLVYLIEKGFRLGTYAICSDHPYDGPHGHAGGLAVDISTINGTSVNQASSKYNVLSLLAALHAAPPHFKPWQLISGGYGYMLDSSCYDQCIPSPWFYGSTTLRQHTNHVHVGYYA